MNWINEKNTRFPLYILGSGVWAKQFTIEYKYSYINITRLNLNNELNKIKYIKSEPMSFKNNFLFVYFEVYIKQKFILDKIEFPTIIILGVQFIY